MIEELFNPIPKDIIKFERDGNHVSHWERVNNGDILKFIVTKKKFKYMCMKQEFIDDVRNPPIQFDEKEISGKIENLLQAFRESEEWEET